MLLDQRGAGQSVPNVSDDYAAALQNNTTADLVEDIEALRKALEVTAGGDPRRSWGSTLAIAYAEAHPERVRQLLLRGIFTFLPDEVDTLFQDGRVAHHYPDEWAAYTGYIRRTSTDWEREKQNLVGAYLERLQNPAQRLEAAKAFVTFELSISHLHQNAERIEATMQNPAQLVPLRPSKCTTCSMGASCVAARLLDDVAAIRNHRIHIVHGRNDTVCLPRAAHRLFQALKAAGAGDNVTLEYIEAAGHSDSEPNISKALRTAADALAREASGT